jgi:hypothetical protein
MKLAMSLQPTQSNGYPFGQAGQIPQGMEGGLERIDEDNVRTGVDKTRSAAMESVGRLVDRALALKEL